MFFTKQDIEEIRKRLLAISVKDTDFPPALIIDTDDVIPFVQDNLNKTMTVGQLVDEFGKEAAALNSELSDFYNITQRLRIRPQSLIHAVSRIPEGNRKLGLVVTFLDNNNKWQLSQFLGQTTDDWTNEDCWVSPLDIAMDDYVVYPDEEDITTVKIGYKNYLKFNDKDYSPIQASGKGIKILRKNWTDEDEPKNLLDQDMVNERNTIYIIQYDFDLCGGTISIPTGCQLYFMGGTINNGHINLRNTELKGITELSDIGTATIIGTFKQGQLITRYNTSTNRTELSWYDGRDWVTLATKLI